MEDTEKNEFDMYFYPDLIFRDVDWRDRTELFDEISKVLEKKDLFIQTFIVQLLKENGNILPASKPNPSESLYPIQIKNILKRPLFQSYVPNSPLNSLQWVTVRMDLYRPS